MRKLLVTIALLLPAEALAAGYSVPNVNPADLAMAGSRLAAQDSAAAAAANPSALARLQGLNVALGGALVDFKASWADPTGTFTPGAADGETSIVPDPALYASYGFRLPNQMAAAVGLGFTIPFGGNVFWPSSWPGRFEAVTIQRRIYGGYLTGAIEPLPWLRVGGGLVLYRGTEDFTQALPTAPTETTAELTTSGTALSYDLSAEIEPVQNLRIGVDYKHQARMTLDGHAHFSNAIPELGLLDQTVKHLLAIPNVLGVGASYRALPLLLVTGAFTWERYVAYDADIFTGSSGTAITVPRKYHNGYTYRLGAEVGPIDKLKVRLGGLRDVSPTPPEWLHASIPDSSLWAATLGLAYAVTPNIEVSGSYLHAWYDEARTCTVSGGTCQPQNVFPGVYGARANIVSVGVTWTTDTLRW